MTLDRPASNVGVMELAPLNVDHNYSLEEHRQRIFQILNATAVDIGVELMAAKRSHAGRFLPWVEAEMPFGVDKAEKLMAIARAFATAPRESMDLLPNAWTALYELSRVPAEVLHRAVEEGTVTPNTTVENARGFVRDANERSMEPPAEPVEVTMPEPVKLRVSASTLATELLSFHEPTELSPTLRGQVLAWIRSAGASVPVELTEPADAAVPG